MKHGQIDLIHTWIDSTNVADITFLVCLFSMTNPNLRNRMLRKSPVRGSELEDIQNSHEILTFPGT